MNRRVRQLGDATAAAGNEISCVNIINALRMNRCDVIFSEKRFFQHLSSLVILVKVRTMQYESIVRRFCSFFKLSMLLLGAGLTAASVTAAASTALDTQILKSDHPQNDPKVISFLKEADNSEKFLFFLRIQIVLINTAALCDQQILLI